MRVIEVKIPEVFDDLHESEQKRLLHGAFRQYARGRIAELKTETVEAEERIREFETHYGVSFSEFEERVLHGLASAEAHDGYNTWLFWESVHNRQCDTLRKLRNLGLVHNESAS